MNGITALAVGAKFFIGRIFCGKPYHFSGNAFVGEAMAGRWSRAGHGSESYAVLKCHPSLLVFPAISGAALLVVFGAIAVTLLPQLGSLHDATHGIWDKLGSDGSGNICSMSAPISQLRAHRHRGVLQRRAGPLRVALHAGRRRRRDGLAAAMSCLPQIFGWPGRHTVGIVLNAIESFLKDKLGSSAA